MFLFSGVLPARKKGKAGPGAEWGDGLDHSLPERGGGGGALLRHEPGAGGGPRPVPRLPGRPSRQRGGTPARPEVRLQDRRPLLSQSTVSDLRKKSGLFENVGGPGHLSVSPPPHPVPRSRRRPRLQRRAPTIARRWRVRQGRREVRAVRPGTHPVGSAHRPRRSRRVVGAIARASGGGSAARPSAARSRRTAWGSVTAPRIRRAPPQCSHTRTSGPRSRTRGGGAEPGAIASGIARRRPGACRPPAAGRSPISSGHAGRGCHGRRATAGAAGAPTRQDAQATPTGPPATQSTRRSTVGGTDRAAGHPRSRSIGPAPTGDARDSGTGAPPGRAGGPGQPPWGNGEMGETAEKKLYSENTASPHLALRPRVRAYLAPQDN